MFDDDDDFDDDKPIDKWADIYLAVAIGFILLITSMIAITA